MKYRKTILSIALSVALLSVGVVSALAMGQNSTASAEESAATQEQEQVVITYGGTIELLDSSVLDDEAESALGQSSFEALAASPTGSDFIPLGGVMYTLAEAEDASATSTALSGTEMQIPLEVTDDAPYLEVLVSNTGDEMVRFTVTTGDQVVSGTEYAWIPAHTTLLVQSFQQLPAGSYSIHLEGTESLSGSVSCSAVAAPETETASATLGSEVNEASGAAAQPTDSEPTYDTAMTEQGLQWQQEDTQSSYALWVSNTSGTETLKVTVTYPSGSFVFEVEPNTSATLLNVNNAEAGLHDVDFQTESGNPQGTVQVWVSDTAIS